MPGVAISCQGIQLEILLRLLSHTDHRETDWHSVPEQSWRALAAACDYHQLSALALRRIDSIPGGIVPAGVRTQLQDRYYRIALTNVLLAKKLVQLTSQLEAEGIPVLVHKGPAVAMAVYGDLALREFQDLDLIVRVEHLPQAIRLMTRAGFRSTGDCRPEIHAERERYYHLTFQAPDERHFVELHWKLAGNLWHSFTLDLDEVWRRTAAVRLPDGQVATLCPEDLFVALCCHGATHRWWRLKWLVDVSELLRGSAGWDWSRVEAMTAARPGARSAACLGILLANALLRAPVPAGAASILLVTERIRQLVDEIRKEMLSQGRTDGDPHRTLLGLEGSIGARIQYRGTLAIRAMRLWIYQVITVRPRDRALIHLPKQFDFLYRYIRLMRLFGKAIRIAFHALRAASDRL